MVNGSIPKGMFVLHRCDNPSCVNPDHLFIGTNQDNMDDMKSKGRANCLRGEESNLHKLTADEVLEIRGFDSAVTNKELARMFKVTPCNVWMVRTKKTWKHV